MTKEINNPEKAYFQHLSVTYKPTNSKEYQQKNAAGYKDTTRITIIHRI
jgi:hypothetical protein